MDPSSSSLSKDSFSDNSRDRHVFARLGQGYISQVEKRRGFRSWLVNPFEYFYTPIKENIYIALKKYNDSTSTDIYIYIPKFSNTKRKYNPIFEIRPHEAPLLGDPVISVQREACNIDLSQGALLK